jgi:hypothetical protein
MPTTSPAGMSTRLRAFTEVKLACCRAPTSHWCMIYMPVLSDRSACDLNRGLRCNDPSYRCCKHLVSWRRSSGSPSVSVQCAQNTLSLVSSDWCAETTFDCCEHANGVARPIEDSEGVDSHVFRCWRLVAEYQDTSRTCIENHIKPATGCIHKSALCVGSKDFNPHVIAAPARQ